MDTPLTALLKRIEAASGPDREIDREIGFALDGWRLEKLSNVMRADASGVDDVPFIRIGNDWVVDHPGGEYTAFTESVDAVIALVEKVLPGWHWHIGHNDGPPPFGDHFRANVYPKSQWGPPPYAIANTPALALCAALLKALSGDERIGSPSQEQTAIEQNKNLPPEAVEP